VFYAVRISVNRIVDRWHGIDTVASRYYCGGTYEVDTEGESMKLRTVTVIWWAVLMLATYKIL
jgi:hypothetical protein